MKAKKLLSNRANGPVRGASMKKQIERRSKATGAEASVADLISEVQSNTTIQISLANAGSTPKVVCLFPGMLKDNKQILTFTGITVDGIAGKDTISDVTVSSDSLPLLQEWAKINPVRFSRIMLSADDEKQWFNKIGTAGFLLDRHLGADEICPHDYISAGQQNPLICELNDLDMQLDSSKIFYVTIGAGRHLDISMHIHCEANLGDTLEAFAEKAEA